MSRIAAILLMSAMTILARIVPAIPHPHILAEARLEIIVDEAGGVARLKHLWRFDEFFSSTVILEFSTGGDFELNDEELLAVSKTIHASLADFNYFQTILSDAQEVMMKPPDQLQAYFDDSQLVVAFETEPRDPLMLSGSVTFGIYDPTLFTAIEFREDEHIAVSRVPAGCEQVIVRPDPYEVIAENRDSLTEDFFNDPTDYAAITATRLEVGCPPKVQ